MHGTSIRTAGIEPATRAPDARGLPLSHALKTNEQSAPRDLNPYFRPGKAVRCRYVRGAVEEGSSV